MGRGESTGSESPLLRSPDAPRASHVDYLGSFTCDLWKASEAWKTSVITYRDDHSSNAGLSSRQMERHVAQRLRGQMAAPNSAYDVLSSDGKRLEVRGFTKTLSFTASSSRGSGRTTTKERLDAKLAAVDGFVVYDATRFPTMPCWLISTRIVRAWIAQGLISRGGSMPRDRFMEQLAAGRVDAGESIEAASESCRVAGIRGAPQWGRWAIELHVEKWDPRDDDEGDRSSLAASGTIDCDLARHLAEVRAAALGRSEISRQAERSLGAVGTLVLDALFVHGRVEPRSALLAEPLLVSLKVFDPSGELYLDTAFEHTPAEIISNYLIARAAKKKRLSIGHSIQFAFELGQATVFRASEHAQAAGWREYGT